MNNTVLVVDDEAPILNMLERAFIKNGYTVRSAESAEVEDSYEDCYCFNIMNS